MGIDDCLILLFDYLIVVVISCVLNLNDWYKSCLLYTSFSAGAVSTDKKFSVEDATLIQKNVVGMTTFDLSLIHI